MPTVFIAGSLAIKHLDDAVKERINKIVENGLSVVVGDAKGADSAVQAHLARRAFRDATVFASNGVPRNNIGDWIVASVATEGRRGTRHFFAAKDQAMAEVADYGLMIWDGKSAGTLRNVLELFSRQKPCVVWLQQRKEFRTVATSEQLDLLLNELSVEAKRAIESKIRLSALLQRISRTASDLLSASDRREEPSRGGAQPGESLNKPDAPGS